MVGVSWHHITGARIITVQDELASKKRTVTDPDEMVTALTEAFGDLYLTTEEKERATKRMVEKDAMESSSVWGAW